MTFGWVFSGKPSYGISCSNLVLDSGCIGKAYLVITTPKKVITSASLREDCPRYNCHVFVVWLFLAMDLSMLSVLSTGYRLKSSKALTRKELFKPSQEFARMISEYCARARGTMILEIVVANT